MTFSEFVAFTGATPVAAEMEWSRMLDTHCAIMTMVTDSRGEETLKLRIKVCAKRRRTQGHAASATTVAAETMQDDAAQPVLPDASGAGIAGDGEVVADPLDTQVQAPAEAQNAIPDAQQIVVD